MFYVKLASDGKPERYPYTLTELKRANKSVSWPDPLTDKIAADYGVYPVVPAPQPADDYTVNLERTAIKQGDAWVEEWIEIPATQKQIEERTAAKAAEVRDDRNQRLANSDWTQLPDAPVDHTEWATYRQALRDATSQPGFPWSVEWPQQP